jgi:flagellar biosynthetic protein FliQ
MSTDAMTIELAQQALMTALVLSAPVLVAGAIIGVAVGLLQSVMQLHDQTLTFVPKLIAIMAVLAALLPWLMYQLSSYAQQMFSEIPSY